MIQLSEPVASNARLAFLAPPAVARRGRSWNHLSSSCPFCPIALFREEKPPQLRIAIFVWFILAHRWDLADSSVRWLRPVLSTRILLPVVLQNGQKVTDPSRIEEIRETIIRNMLEYHPEAAQAGLGAFVSAKKNVDKTENPLGVNLHALTPPSAQQPAPLSIPTN